MCPSPGCGAGLVPADGSRRVECDRRMGCGFVFCRNCRECYHEGLCQTLSTPQTGDVSQVNWPITVITVYGVCTVLQELTNLLSYCSYAQGFSVSEEACLRGRWEQASLRLIRESTKRCPKCSVPVERNGNSLIDLIYFNFITLNKNLEILLCSHVSWSFSIPVLYQKWTAWKYICTRVSGAFLLPYYQLPSLGLH